MIMLVENFNKPIPVTARSKAWACGRSLAGIVGSNPAGGMDVCQVLRVVRYRCLRRADQSCRGALTEFVCVIECDHVQQ
jgi:hypothetical protein